MGFLLDARALVLKYPLTFLALGAACALSAPVVAVSTSAALRPWAKRILSTALSVRREAERVADATREAYAELRADAEADAGLVARPRAEAREGAAAHRGEARATHLSAPPAA